MTSTHIFTDAEMAAMSRRLHGEVSDKTGAFSRAREKLREIQAWTKPEMRGTFHKLLKQRRTTKTEEKAPPNDEKTLDEFISEVGY